MRYFEIVSYPRPFNARKYPVTAVLEVEAKDFRAIERIIADQTQAKVVGHDLGEGDRVLVHVACASEEVKRRLESRWT